MALEQHSPHSRSSGSDFLFRSLHLFVLWNFAVAQPLFDLLARHPEFFVIRQSGAFDILLFTVSVSVLHPTPLVLLFWVFQRMHPILGSCLHLLTLWSCIVALSLQAVQDSHFLPGAALVLGAGICSLLAVYGYRSVLAIRTFLTMLSPALLIFPILFLFFSPISKIVFGTEGHDADTTAVQTQSAPPIIMIVFDELALTALLDKELQIDAAQYPHFAAFAQHATWFRNATTVSDTTGLAVPAIQTGKYPDPSLLPTPADQPHNIFTLLKDIYALKAFGTFTMLCPDDLCDKAPKGNLLQRTVALGSDLSIVYLHLLLPLDFRAWLPPITQNWMNFGSPRVPSVPPVSQLDNKERTRIGKAIWASITKDILIDRFQQFTEFVSAIEPRPQPTFYFLHILLPHVPYVYLPSGKLYSKNTPVVGLSEKKEGEWGNDPWAAAQNYQRYLLQVGFVDTLFGQLLTHLRSVNLYDRSLIVVTADHGVSFRNGEFRRQISETNIGDIAVVPLFIKAPHQKEKLLIDAPTETIDILPTVADLLGLTLPWPVDGQSVFTRTDDRTDLTFVSYKNRQERLKLRPVPQRVLQESIDYKLRLMPRNISTQSLDLIQNDVGLRLIGRSLQDFDLRDDETIAVAYDSPDSFTSVDPQSSFIPAHITGRIRSQAGEQTPHTLAISIKGIIQAVTRPWEFPVKDVSGSWSAIVPENVFRSGANAVETFVISKTAERVILLRPTGVFDQLPEYPAADQRMMRSPQDTLHPVAATSLQGWVDQAAIRDGHLEVAGWAADIRQESIPESIWVYVNGEFVYKGKVMMSRLDVVKEFSAPALQRSGFCYTVPLAQFKGSPSLTVRLFAVSQYGHLSELHYPPTLRGGGTPHPAILLSNSSYDSAQEQ